MTPGLERVYDVIMTKLKGGNSGSSIVVLISGRTFRVGLSVFAHRHTCAGAKQLLREPIGAVAALRNHRGYRKSPSGEQFACSLNAVIVDFLEHGSPDLLLEFDCR